MTTGFAAFVSVAFAVGYALVAIPILSLLAGTKTAIAIGLFFNLFTGAQFWFQRRYVSWPDAIAILPVSLLATLVGLFFFFHVQEAGLSGLLAVYLIVFVGTHGPAQRGREAPETPPIMAPIFAGALSGLFHGMLGIGGPPLATYLKTRRLPKHAFRATLMLCFFLSNLLRVAGSLDLFQGETFWGYVAGHPRVHRGLSCRRSFAARFKRKRLPILRGHAPPSLGRASHSEKRARAAGSALT